MAGKDPQPIVEDQYLAAQIYFAAVMGLVALESLAFAPAYLLKKIKKKPFIKKSSRHSKIRVLCHKLSSYPSLIPTLTSHRLPDLARFLIFAALNVLFGYNRLRFTTDYKLYGWLTIANGGACLLLAPRGPYNPFTTFLRVPTNVVLYYHRLMGLGTIFHGTFHWGTTAAHYIRTGQLSVVLTSTFTNWGLAAWGALVLIALTALVGAFRRRFYEVFFYAHFSFIIFVVGACVHAKHSPEFLLPGFVLWGVDRLGRFAFSFRKVTPAVVVHYPMGSPKSSGCGPEDHKTPSGAGVTKFRLEGVRVTHPNQMAWVRLPGVSAINWHPFTVASAPGDRYATIAVRGLGGFTRRLQNLALETTSSCSTHEKKVAPGGAVTLHAPNIKVSVDGPYGVNGIIWEQHPVVALVAGGIGITPSISITSHIVRWAAQADRCNIRGDGWHVHLVWAVRDMNSAQWFEEELSELTSLIAETNAPVTLDIDIFVSSRAPAAAAPMMAHEDESSVGLTDQNYAYRGPGVVHQGRPDMNAWMRSIAQQRRGMDVAVSLCGPRNLIDDARKAAVGACSENGLFHIEEEVFEF